MASGGAWYFCRKSPDGVPNRVTAATWFAMSGGMGDGTADAGTRLGRRGRTGGAGHQHPGRQRRQPNERRKPAQLGKAAHFLKASFTFSPASFRLDFA